MNTINYLIAEQTLMHTKQKTYFAENKSELFSTKITCIEIQIAADWPRNGGKHLRGVQISQQ